MTVSPEPYPANSHMMLSSDVYPTNYLPTASNDQHPGNNYLPSVSYSLDHLDRLDYQVVLGFLLSDETLFDFSGCHSHLWLLLQGPEMLPHQPSSESCLIGCYSSEEGTSFPRQVHETHVRSFVSIVFLLETCSH